MTAGPVPLGRDSLTQLDPRVAVPSYDRDTVDVGIVHVGVGNFFRAHQATYLDEVLAAGHRRWGISGVGVLPHDAAMAQALAAQDGLFSVTTKHPDGTWEPRVVGSLVEHHHLPAAPGAVLARLADPATRMVTLTVTEGGYAVTDGVLAGIAAGGPPTSHFGLLLAALQRRRRDGTPPFAVVSCDNLAGNGTVARAAYRQVAEVIDPELAAWLADTVEFPNSMVDRITPVTSEEDRAALTDRYGIEDRWPVMCEPYRQWVLEDSFAPGGRPPLEEVGVQLVADVMPYELMKLRLLNSTHQALAYFGWLLGYRWVHEAAADPDLVALLRAYLAEAVPTLLPVPGIDLAAYQDMLLVRYANPHVRDTVARLCADTSARIPQWVLPTIRDNLAAGRPVRIGAAVVASWARYATGLDEQGQPYRVDDRLVERLVPLARQQDTDREAFLRDSGLFEDLGGRPEFREPYLAVLDSLTHRGARASLRELLGR